MTFPFVNYTNIVLKGARYLLLYLYVQQNILFSLLSFVYTQKYNPYTSHVFLFSLIDVPDCVSTHLKEFDDGCTLIKSSIHFAHIEVLIRPLTKTSLSFHVCVRVLRVYLVLIVFSFVWTWPIDKINNLILDPALLADLLGISYNTAVRYMATFSGLGQSLLFSVCPTIFKFLSCIEGSSASMEQAEQKAMIYFWYFYIVARFMGPVLLNAAQSYHDHENEEGTLEETFMNTMVKLTSEIPKSLGPAALTYIIFSALINWPAFYLLQSGNFITKLLGMDWLNNYILKGGGIGRDVPYRIYVDSGYIFACLISMAPMVPLLGPFCLLHFLIVSPILRWLLVFTYRPKFDSGGGTCSCFTYRLMFEVF
jgi:hypothetical protein